MRKNYVDNLRSAAILLLIPYHTFMMYNNWGEGQFVPGTPAAIPSYCIRLTAPWFMPMLFLLAGISAYHSITKTPKASHCNNIGNFIKERFLRLLLPFVTGMIVYVPLMSYIADFVHNGYDNGYFAHYKIFFTRITDFGGADGGLTPAHLWFLLFLFVISLSSLAIIIPLRRFSQKSSNNNLALEKLLTSIFFLIIIGAIPILLENVIDIGGKSLTSYLAVFLSGYFVFGKDEAILKLSGYRYLLLGLTLCSGLVLGSGINRFDAVFIDIISGFYGWLFILSALAFSYKNFNSTGKIRAFFRKYSFLIYQFHYPVLVVLAFLIHIEFTSTIGPDFIPVLILVTYIVTIPLSFLIGNIPIVKTFFGQK
jgi:hypothetical protein